jgi:hypothetical protein
MVGAHCPTCGQSLPTRGLVCGICHKPIKRDAGWHVVNSMVQHRSCTDPELKQSQPSAQESFLKEDVHED